MTNPGILSGKIAIVTGGGSGIGLGICQGLVNAGAHVMVGQIDIPQMEPRARELPNTTFIETDVADAAALQSLVDRTLTQHDRIDILVNNAALTGMRATSPFLTTTPALLRQVLAVNFEAAFLLSQLVANEMVKAGSGGSIVHISSVGAWAAQEYASAYCATKAALVSLAQTMALELAPHRIRVNAVLPGDIRTPANEHIVSQLESAGSSGRFMRITPAGRRGTPEDVAGAVTFLASDAAAFITGAAIPVDGGWLIY